MRCIRTKRYKAITKKEGERAENLLFDMISDPREEYNIYDDTMQLGMELINTLNAIAINNQKKAFKPRDVIIDKKTEERLKALGYIK